jgi:hypothetical protein
LNNRFPGKSSTLFDVFPIRLAYQRSRNPVRIQRAWPIERSIRQRRADDHDEGRNRAAGPRRRVGVRLIAEEAINPG